MVNRYFEIVERIISSFQEIISNQTIRKNKYNDAQGMIAGEIEFTDRTELSFMEMKFFDPPNKKKYKYHYMNKDKELIFRYDNAQHFPNLETFPHHKHLPNSVEKSDEPEMTDVLSEIHGIIKNK